MISYKQAIETLTNHAVSNLSLPLDEKKNLMNLGDSLIKFGEELENKTVQPPTDDIPVEEGQE